ncbi:glycosyltransferase family 4 protein [Pirellulaceae bacterium SH501]
MTPSSSDTPEERRRMLVQAYCFHPDGTMEERNGWQRALQGARRFDVTVLYSNPKKYSNDFYDYLPPEIPSESIRFIEIKNPPLSRHFERSEYSFYAGYRTWQKLAFARAAELQAQKPFDLSHTVTLCGYREPGMLWNLPIPHLWGPIGGTHELDPKFYRYLDPMNRAREQLRTWINQYQLRRCPRVRKAIRHSQTVLVASRAAQRDFEKHLGMRFQVELETGIDHSICEEREPRNSAAPLRLLWAGRIRAWKGLPLFLHALAVLPKSVPVEVRVLGDGGSKQGAMDLAKNLGVSERIDWRPWPRYRDSLAHYRWADAFVFTSLRDTSGTGLLEALAAGTPIIGLNHQGAADIMDDSSAIRISVDDPERTIGEIADGIEKLWRLPAHWHALSRGATKRAHLYHWSNRQDAADRIFDSAIRITKSQETPLPLPSKMG